MKTYMITMGWRDFVMIGLLVLQTIFLVLNIKSRKEIKSAEKNLDEAQKYLQGLQKYFRDTASMKKENDDTYKSKHKI